MGKDDVFTRVVAAVVDHLPRADAGMIAPGTTLAEIGADSLDAAEVLFALEEKFSVRLRADKVLTALTVGELVDRIKTERSKHVTDERGHRALDPHA